LSLDFATTVHLNRYLEPFKQHLTDPSVSEICINGTDGGYWVERSGAAALEFVEASIVTDGNLRQLAQMLASNTGQAINKEKPLLSCVLPTGERVQVVFPPVSPRGVAFSIRKQVVKKLTLQEYAALGAFDQVGIVTNNTVQETDAELCELLQSGCYMEFIACAAQKRKNMIISGGTSTGKTTMLNAVLQSINVHERIITIEDTAELQPPQPNWLSLLASKGEQGVAKVTIQDLLEASLRLRPDRILLGELRGKEAYTFLRAVNTGHPGSITTVHADNPHAALQQIALMVQQGDIKMTQEQILAYINSIVDIIIQLSRVDGKRIVSRIWYSGLQNT
jgi:type IV secretion system protein VirB11